jgi:UTP-glucose-1-phosphate uridylyltransferase
MDFGGKTFDCGSAIDFLAANVAFSPANPEIAPAFVQD